MSRRQQAGAGYDLDLLTSRDLALRAASAVTDPEKLADAALVMASAMPIRDWILSEDDLDRDARRRAVIRVLKNLDVVHRVTGDFPQLDFQQFLYSADVYYQMLIGYEQ